MFRKIKDFLYALSHIEGQLVSLEADLGPFTLNLWVGREDADTVRFAVDVELLYGNYEPPLLDVSVEVGVIKVELSLSSSSSD